MAGQCTTETDFLLKQCLGDPWHGWDRRNFDLQRNPRILDCNLKKRDGVLWINAYSVPEGLTRRTLQRQEVFVLNENQKLKANRVHVEAKGQGETYQEDSAVLVALLKACAMQKDLCKGSRIHAGISKRGLIRRNISLGNAVVNMYAKCGELVKAQEVLDELPVRDVFSWGALIAGYSQHGYGLEALNCLEWMQQEGLSPNSVIFTCILKSCGSIGAIEKGKEIHAEVYRQGLLENNIVLGTALVDMYAKCGALGKAQEVFDELPIRNVVSWGALVAGYAQHGHGHQALNCFERMQHEGFSPNPAILTCTLKACGIIGATKKGEEIHAKVVKQGLLETNTVIVTALLDMYVKCGALVKAQEMFNELPVRNVVSWGVLISGYVHNGHDHQALNCFERMQQEGLSPNAVIFTCTLKACSSIGATAKGEKIHAEVVGQGLLEKDALLGDALVDMYAKSGALVRAQEVFDKLPAWSVVACNALMTGYAQHGHGHQALTCFERMQQEGLSPNAFIFTCIFKAYGRIRAAEKGEAVHAQVVRWGLIEKDIILGTAMVDMYARCGALVKAEEVFDKLPFRDVVTCNALMAGYTQHGHDHQALNCFEWMQNEGLSPDAITYTCILNACGSVGVAQRGEEIHAEVVRRGLLEKDTILGNVVVDMYARCGALMKAQEVLDELPVRSVVAWSALISGYAQLGKVEAACNSFNKMMEEGIEPDAVTFTVLLTACSHSGLVDEGQMLYKTMNTNYLIVPTSEHHTCMVDLFCRAGHFDKAIGVIEKVLPSGSSSLPLLSSLLGVCGKWGNVMLAKLAFEHVVQLDEKNAAAYVCMSNIHAASRMEEEGCSLKSKIPSMEDTMVLVVD